MTSRQRVVLDASSFINGWLIATTLWVGVLLVVALFVYGVPLCGPGKTPGASGVPGSPCPSTGTE